MGRKRTGSQSAQSRPQPEQPRNVLHDGPARNIAYARLSNGSEPARAFFDSLSGEDQNKFMSLFVTMCETGRILNEEKFHYISGGDGEAVCNHSGEISRFRIAEFKIHTGEGKRFLACLDGRQWVLTHGFAKGGKVSTECRKAERIFCDDMSQRLNR